MSSDSPLSISERPISRCACERNVDWVWQTAILFTAAIAFNVWAVHLNWHGSIYESHGFRQAQTAITTEYLLNGGPFFSYETPVLGPPWSVPFEFPLYQGIVAISCKVFGTGLEITGRFVSVVFFYLSLAAMYSVLTALGLSKSGRLVCLSLLLLSPFYIYWSRAFMIESCALFFAISYFAAFLWHFRSPPSSNRSTWLLGCTCVLGCIAGLVKVTTFVPFLYCACAAVLYELRAEIRSRNLHILVRSVFSHRCVRLFFFAFLIPVACTVLWTHHADQLKLQNPFGVLDTSSALRFWNFGSWDQRASWRQWAVHTLRDSIFLMGSTAALLIGFVLLLRARSGKLLAVASLGIYLVTVVTFINLFFVHEYYTYSVGIFLICSIGIVLSKTMQQSREMRSIAVLMLLLCVTYEVTGYFENFEALQQSDSRLYRLQPVTRALDKLTEPGAVLLIYGLDWSPEVPYMAKRRAIMPSIPTVPEYAALRRRYFDLHSPQVQASLANLGNEHLGALVVCAGERTESSRVLNYVRALHLQERRAATSSTCDIYVPQDAGKR